jgi:CBS domain-containing protein
MTAQLTKTTVASVMTPDPVAVNPHTPFKEILELLADRAIGAVPVLSATGAVVGVVSEADLLRAPRRGARLSAGELMRSPAPVVRPDTALADAARMVRTCGRVFVVDAGRLVGVLARHDVLSTLLRPDKEIQVEVEREVIGSAPSVRVGVDEGIVLLTGRLPWRADIDALVGRVAAVSGVIDVRNRLVCEFGAKRAR